MPWNNGGPSQGPSPWGTGGGNDGPGQPPPNGPGGPNRGRPPGGPPDLDQLIAQAQDFIRNLLGGGGSRGRGPAGPGGGGSMGGFFSSGRGLSITALAVFALWIATGIYRVQPDEQGVILRFGAYYDWSKPGLHWHVPWPIEEVLKPAVTRIKRTEIGFRSGPAGLIENGRDAHGRDVLAESLMLTGDENIIDIDVAVFWRVRIGTDSASKFLFNARDAETLVRGVAESSMREEIGRTPIIPALYELRAKIEADVQAQAQQILDRYNVGVEIIQVQLQKVDPPAAVIESFRDVQRANTDKDRLQNEAESYRNDIVPRARGEAARIVAEAQGVRLASIAQATGQAERFNSVLKAYELAKDVTLRRMYIDTMTDVLSHAQTLVVDDNLRGLVPFLPLNLPSAPPPPPAANAAPQGGASK